MFENALSPEIRLDAGAVAQILKCSFFCMAIGKTKGSSNVK